jgi:hypothetical protein
LSVEKKLSAAGMPRTSPRGYIKRKERGTYPLVQARFLPVMCDHCEREAWPGPCRVARQAVAANTGRVLRLQVLGNENDCRESRPGGKQAA